jgi:acetate---CoA ligase (ADP-forming)
LPEVLPDFGNLNNPLDGTGAMYDDDKIFPRLLQALIDDANIDIVTVNLEANDPRPKELKSGNRFSQAIASAATGANKPIAIFSSVVGGPVDSEILLPLRTAGVPLMEGAECAMSALRNLTDYHQFRKSWQPSGQQDAASVSSHPKFPAGILPAEAAFSLLDSFGIPVAPTVLTRNADDAATAAERIGFPVALKIESAQIGHKSDVGGVALNLAAAVEVRDAFLRIRDRVTAKFSTADIAGVVVQRMAPEGIEMILGIKRDPLFGPVVVCGFGGVLVELLKDVAIGIPPISRQQAHSLLQGLRGWPLLTGLRGKPPGDVDALCDAIVKASNLAVSLGEQLLALDINPLVVHATNHGVVAVDALVQIG